MDSVYRCAPECLGASLPLWQYRASSTPEVTATADPDRLRGLAAELVAAVPEVATVVNTHAAERSPQSEPDGEVGPTPARRARHERARWTAE